MTEPERGRQPSGLSPGTPDQYTPMGMVDQYGKFGRGLRGALHDRSRPAVRATAWVLVAIVALMAVAFVIGMVTSATGG